MILTNHKQNQQLTSLRCWLLTMMMSGQITVKEAAQKFYEATGGADVAAEKGGEYGDK